MILRRMTAIRVIIRTALRPSGLIFLSVLEERIMANPSIKQQLNDLIAQVISKQIGDPMHKDEWEEVRRPLLEALNNLEKVGKQ